jgi:AcrR family transcriptional regulator
MAAPQSVIANTRYDRRLGEILACAAQVFCDKGYDAASIRDISRATGASLAGLYYYFESKEQLLYLIQKDAFETLISRLSERLTAQTAPVARLRAIIDSHLAYTLEEPVRMKVLSHEDDTLKGPLQAEIAALKRRYYRLCLGVVEEVRREHGLEKLNPRLVLMSLFGMMNWIYTWHKPQTDPPAAALSEQMAAVFLNGILNKGRGRKR